MVRHDSKRWIMEVYRAERRGWSQRLTEHKYIKDKDNQSDNTAARAIPDSIVCSVESIVPKRSRKSQGREEELKKDGLYHLEDFARCVLGKGDLAVCIDFRR